MPSSIQRGGYWWNQRPDGVWLRWSPANAAWEPQEGDPPPPGTPPPPPTPDGAPVARTAAGARMTMPTTAATTAVSEVQASAGQASVPPTAAIPAREVSEPKAAAPASETSGPEATARAEPDETPAEPSAAATDTNEGDSPSEAAVTSPQAAAPPTANAETETPAAETAPRVEDQGVEDQATEDQAQGSLAPLAPVVAAANAPVFSKSTAAPRALLENRGLLATLGAVLVLLVFLGTYTGANLFFSEIYGTQVAHAEEKAGSEKMSRAKRAYIAKLDRACARQSGRVERLQVRLASATTGRQVARLLTRLAALADRSLDRAASIPQPQQDRKLLTRIFKLERSAAPLVDRLIDAAQEGNSAAVDATAAEVYAKAAESAQLMERYGFEVCGRS